MECCVQCNDNTLYDFWVLRSLNLCLLLPFKAANKKSCHVLQRTEKSFRVGQMLLFYDYWVRVALVLCMQFLFMCANLCTWGSVLFGCCWAKPWSNWAGIRLLINIVDESCQQGWRHREEELSDKHPGNILHSPRLLQARSLSALTGKDSVPHWFTVDYTIVCSGCWVCSKSAAV